MMTPCAKCGKTFGSHFAITPLGQGECSFEMLSA
jgi:hypothetical protein